MDSHKSVGLCESSWPPLLAQGRACLLLLSVIASLEECSSEAESVYQVGPTSSVASSCFRRLSRGDLCIFREARMVGRTTQLNRRALKPSRRRHVMNTSASLQRSPLTFFLLVFVLALPFWLLGALVTHIPLPINLPVSALQFVCPMIAACILVFKEEKPGGIKRLLKSVFG